MLGFDHYKRGVLNLLIHTHTHTHKWKFVKIAKEQQRLSVVLLFLNDTLSRRRRLFTSTLVIAFFHKKGGLERKSYLGLKSIHVPPNQAPLGKSSLALNCGEPVLAKEQMYN